MPGSHLLRCLLLAGVSWIALFSGVCAGELSSTLKPQVNEHAVYGWNARHQAVMERNRTVKPEYVIFGDSITHRWGGEPSGDKRALGTGKAAWENLFSPHTVTNMGFGSDYVDNAYYRVQLGELDGISPRVIIVLLGINNLCGRTRRQRSGLFHPGKAAAACGLDAWKHFLTLVPIPPFRHEFPVVYVRRAAGRRSGVPCIFRAGARSAFLPEAGTPPAGSV
ncbi:GDSL-type esterase/lipase family protein [Akkermansia muciniphila]|uniref:GDSL-type esterase/lipase family protein n=1 Tax=Akkermansia muciniphila TaxID=239935 RepID=UPI002155BC5D|nr:GDSL-type esterase/lipase family protein [Akkermansia muciniphila]